VVAVTQFHYDDFNRLVSSVDALTGVSSQGFDADGNRTRLTDPNQNNTHLEFDLGGRLVQETVATGNQVDYTYNARDLLAQVTNARGQARQFIYDAASRLTSWTDPDGTWSYTYDNNGNVLTVTDPQGTITHTYDALNRVVSYTDVNGNTLRYEYDEVGNLITLTYPDNKLVHYEYDAADQLVKVTDWAGRETRYEYDANGRLIKTTRPNGTSQTRRYDTKGQLLAQTDLDAQGNVLVAYTFGYDAAGNLLQERVTPELLPVLPARVKMTYTAANRLATYNGQAVPFDADGNLLTAPLQGQMSSLQFDSRHRLVQAGPTSYRYDAENQRIGVTQTNYIVNSQPALSQVLVKEEDGTKTFYVYGLGLLGDEREGEYRTYHFDFRGSTVALTDARGQVTQRFQYGPYGELVKEDSAVTPFLFNGRYGVMTDGNGLYYMRARFYSPEIKRFVNQDVLWGSVGEGQTLNRYAFVTGQPVSLVDPFGLEAEILFGGYHWYGHVALRINQKVYSNGRYNFPGQERELSSGGLIGPNVLKVTSVNAYLSDSAKKILPLGYTLNLTKEQEEAIGAYYKEVIKTAKPLGGGKYLLPDKYNFFLNNCATLTRDALMSGLPWYYDVFFFDATTPMGLELRMHSGPILFFLVKDVRRLNGK
jgi:RHS repeat-associated protein